MGLMTKIMTPDYEGESRRSGDLPWWVRSIAVIGIPGAIAVFLVWVGSQEIPKIKAETQATRQAVEALQRSIAEYQEQNSALLRMMQRVCSNTARNEYDRQRCFDR